MFHRTVTVSEYEKMASQRNSAKEQNISKERAQTDKIFRRYSIRFAPGTARVPPGYGVELSVLHDNDNANRTLLTIDGFRVTNRRNEQERVRL